MYYYAMVKLSNDHEIGYALANAETSHQARILMRRVSVQTLGRQDIELVDFMELSKFLQPYMKRNTTDDKVFVQMLKMDAEMLAEKSAELYNWNT